MINEKNPLVSIIIPIYNCEKYLVETLNSVISQTYTNWEAICVDDCSKDESLDIVKSYALKDQRIKIFCQETNSGAAKARNTALSKSLGRFIAYLDSDDIWQCNKLEKQINYMLSHNIGACITSYQTVEEDGTFRNEVIVPKQTTYKSMLKGPLTCTHTIVFDLTIVEKDILYMPDIRAGQDFATWLNVVKSGHIIYGMSNVLAKYRQHAKSISSNRLKALKRTWNIYRRVENINVFSSSYYFICYTIKAIMKRVHKKPKSR